MLNVVSGIGGISAKQYINYLTVQSADLRKYLQSLLELDGKTSSIIHTEYGILFMTPFHLDNNQCKLRKGGFCYFIPLAQSLNGRMPSENLMDLF